MTQQTPLLLIHPADNVAVALDALAAGQAVEVAGREIAVRASVPLGHKVAILPISAGSPVIKYGQPIGCATADICTGEHVHKHNLRTALAGVLEYRFEPKGREQGARGGEQPEAPYSVLPALSFDGFVRESGEVGIRNEIWILPTVGCVNEVAENLARRFREALPGGIDGVYAFTHPYGCSQLGDDLLNTQRILAGLARHPNAGGVLLIGLGCENNTMASLRRQIGDDSAGRYRFMVSQDVGDELAAGFQLLEELAAFAGCARRQSLPIARLRVGMKCGGSDGLSGITANPLIGALCDELVARGATGVLTEVPEMFGAESLFMNRCSDRATFDKCVAMINGFKEYFLRHGQAVYENPSPGNNEGGITTLEEKSLGCLQKGGTSPVADVVPYGGRLVRPGLNFVAGPGNDAVSTTALVAAGCQMVVFSTGRGTPFGGPVPTLKIASNTSLAQRKPAWIDFDAGRLLAGASMPALAAELLTLVVEVASGRQLARNETNGFRQIAIFKEGVTL